MTPVRVLIIDDSDDDALLVATGLWQDSMTTLAATLVATVVVMLLGIAVGVWLGRDTRADRLIRPILDAAQTMPSFVYLVPFLALFGIVGIIMRFAPLGAFALEHIERSGCELRRVKLLQQRLQGDDFTRRNAAVQHCPKLLSHCFLAIMRAALRPAEIERRESSARKLP